MATLRKAYFSSVVLNMSATAVTTEPLIAVNGSSTSYVGKPIATIMASAILEDTTGAPLKVIGQLDNPASNQNVTEGYEEAWPEQVWTVGNDIKMQFLPIGGLYRTPVTQVNTVTVP